VIFAISEFAEQQIARTEIDLQSDGVVDIINLQDDRYISASYLQAGYYQATVTLTTQSNQVETTLVPISVQTPAQLNLQIQRVWANVAGALRAGDGPAALVHFTPEAAELYGPVLQQMGAGLPALADAFTPISLASVNGGIVECLLVRNVAGQDQGFLVTFVRGNDGVWRLARL
jgi:hypothetical protein